MFQKAPRRSPVANVKGQFNAVFLDVGGVILQIDWNRPFEFVGIMDPRRRQELIESFVGWKHFHLFERGQITADEFFSGFNAKWGVTRDNGTWKQAWESLIVGEIAGVGEIFDELKGKFPIYALSNTNVVHYQFQFPRYPILKRFDRFFTSFELAARKPDAEIYLAAARAAGVHPNQCLFVDDSLENVEAARRVGFTAERTENSARETLDFLRAHLPFGAPAKF
jgi:HAD superfamily hydrolase (TIGR01549 family)